MTDNTIVVEESTVETPEKVPFFKKILNDPKKLAIGAGAALALVAGAVWFAVKRSDEEDFEDEFPSELDSDSSTDNAV